MSNVDTIGLLILTAAALAYMYDTDVPKEQLLPGVPNQQREVDLTRWRHDGTQPVYWKSGNAAKTVDETASMILEYGL